MNEPEPLPEPVAVIQVAFDFTVHAQPAATVNVTVPFPLAGFIVRVPGVNVTAHGLAGWLTVNGLPPIVSDPDRDALSGFADTVYLTVPLPSPLVPEVTVIQLVELLTAVHEHPAVVVIVAEAVPPPYAMDCVAGDTVLLHEVAVRLVAAAWFTVNVRPATVRVPDRGAPEVLASTT